jgi:hypothetical protein
VCFIEGGPPYEASTLSLKVDEIASVPRRSGGFWPSTFALKSDLVTRFELPAARDVVNVGSHRSAQTKQSGESHLNVRRGYGCPI